MANPSPKPENQIDYIELATSNIPRIKDFYTASFGWSFRDHGDAYTSFHDGRLRGGFLLGEPPAKGLLLVIYASDLDAAQKRITDAGGVIARDTYEFPGGRRFHFTDPDGNELAVWSE